MKGLGGKVAVGLALVVGAVTSYTVYQYVDRVTQQADILPSILDYLQIDPGRRVLFGQSIFRSSEGRAFLHLNGHYWLVRGQRALEFVPNRTEARFFDPARDLQLSSPIAGSFLMTRPKRPLMRRDVFMPRDCELRKPSAGP